jgi:hypothetical protein
LPLWSTSTVWGSVFIACVRIGSCAKDLNRFVKPRQGEKLTCETNGKAAQVLFGIGVLGYAGYTPSLITLTEPRYMEQDNDQLAKI